MCACVYEREVLVGYPGHAGLPLPLLHPPCARREAAELPHTPRVRQPVCQEMRLFALQPKRRDGRR